MKHFFQRITEVIKNTELTFYRSAHPLCQCSKLRRRFEHDERRNVYRWILRVREQWANEELLQQ